MRNLKKILCLALVLSMVLAVVSGAAYKDYADADEITWVNEEYVLAAELLQDIGVVVGVEEDGKTYYKPDDLLTRAELARVLYVLHSGVADGEIYNTGAIFETLPSTFTDIDGHWAEGYIKYGQNAGYLNGKSAEIFDPDANVKAQEMATALLVVIGYKAADLSANYPANVVKYGYVGTEGNLFTTGLSNAYQDETIGTHVVGLGAGKTGCYVADEEKELVLSAEVTREEAFFMMYKAIAKRSMVTKLDFEHNADGQYYWSIDTLYVEKFGIDFDQELITDVVAGSSKYAFTGKYAADGKVVLDKNGEVIDYGYAATQKYANNVVGYGYTFANTDWAANTGKEVTGLLTTWGGKAYFTHYAFKYAVNKTTVTGPKGEDVVVTKETKIAVDGAKIKINGVAYESYYADGFRYIVNYSNGVKKTAAELAAVLEAETATKDEIVLKVIDGKLYGVIEEETVFATVSAAKNADGKIELTLADGSKKLIAAEFAKGDRVYGFYNNKTAAYELAKVEPTAIVNVAVETVDGAKKYFFEDKTGTEFKLGASSNLANWTEKVFNDGVYAVKVDGEDFVKNETAYWALYIIDGYCFDAVKTEKVQTIELYVTSKSVVYNTTDNKTTYTFGLNTKADGKGTAYTYTKTVTSTDPALEGIAKGDVVRYAYDVKTKAAISITKLIKIKATTEDEALTGYTQTWAVAQQIQAAMATADANPNAIVVYYGMPMLKANTAPYAETDAFAIKYLSQAQYDLIQPYLNGTKNMEFTK